MSVSAPMPMSVPAPMSVPIPMPMSVPSIPSATSIVPIACGTVPPTSLAVVDVIPTTVVVPQPTKTVLINPKKKTIIAKAISQHAMKDTKENTHASRIVHFDSRGLQPPLSQRSVSPQNKQPLGPINTCPAYTDKAKILVAAAKGDVVFLSKLKEADRQLSQGFAGVCDYAGRNVLHLAAWHGQVAVLEMLLVGGAALSTTSAVSSSGNTILHCAAYGGDPQTVEWLLFQPLLCKSMIHAKNRRLMTPIEVATEVGHTAVVSLLSTPSHVTPL